MGGCVSSGMLLTNCIFHEDTTPSLGVYPDHYFCFGCKAHGSLRDLWDAVGSPGTVILAAPDRTDSWFDRPRWGGDTPLAEYAERSHRALVTQPHTHWYLNDRAIDSQIESVGLGWDSGWLTVPVTNDRLEIVGIVARAYPHIASKTNMRYDMPGAQGSLMFVPNWELWREAEVHYVVFGVLDAISMVVAGLASASPTAGKASFDPGWLDSVDGSIVVVPDRWEDKDAFGLAARLDWRGRTHLVEYSELEKDPNDILVHRGAEGLKHAMETGK